MFTLISYQEARCGFFENDWQIIRTINSPKELLDALKEGYLKDASNRSLYPLQSFPINNTYTYKDLSMYEGYTYLGGYYNDNSFESDNPDLRSSMNDNYLLDFLKNSDEYKNSFIKFEKWKKKIKSFIPRIRELKYQYDKKESDLKCLFSLAEQYGYKIEKENNNA